MMVLRAHALGLPIAVLSENRDDPAAQVCQNWMAGRLDQSSRVKAFLKSCSVVTFESEFLHAELLRRLSRQTATPIFPKASHMGLLQDRLSQKRLLRKYGLPTSPFLKVATQAEARQAFLDLGKKVVFKKRRFGYDGYGTFVVKTHRELESFLPELGRTSHGFIAEPFIPFQREVAVMIARGRDGSTATLPFVETHQENSRCLWVKGPLRSTARLRRLAGRLRRFLESLGYVGVMGVELFESGRGFLVNELAPRVHNSGHYSLEGLTEDQFTIHLKCVLGLPFKAPRLRAPGFAMMNLLGETVNPPIWRPPSDVALHWYGKCENRPGRKMGHFTVLSRSPETALKKARRRRADFKL